MRATTPLSQHTRRVKLSRTRNGSMKPTVSRVSHCRVKSPVLFTCTSKIESNPLLEMKFTSRDALLNVSSI